MEYKHILFLNQKYQILNWDSIESSQEVPSGWIEFERSYDQIFNPAPNHYTWRINFSENIIIPLYYYDDVNHLIVHRPQEDIYYDIEHLPQAPSQLDRIESQIIYTAMMTDTLLEEG